MMLTDLNINNRTDIYASEKGSLVSIIGNFAIVFILFRNFHTTLLKFVSVGFDYLGGRYSQRDVFVVV